MIGYALGKVMNMGVTLAMYGSICRARGEAFVFPGSPQQYNGVTDARPLGRHAVWSATEPGDGLPGQSGLRPLVPRPVRHASRAEDHPTSRLDDLIP
jgi:hypothetical protein